MARAFTPTAAALLLSSGLFNFAWGLFSSHGDDVSVLISSRSYNFVVFRFAYTRWAVALRSRMLFRSCGGRDD